MSRLFDGSDDCGQEGAILGATIPTTPIDTLRYLELCVELSERGYGAEWEWAQKPKLPPNADAFIGEYVWVVINAGLREQVGRRIFERVMHALDSGSSAGTVFGHTGKTQAIDHVWSNREVVFSRYISAGDKLAYLRSLPWIGPITCYHLARNLGLDVCKPDRHLMRLARANGTTPDELCKRLSADTGDRVGAVDVVLWRAANLGLI